MLRARSKCGALNCGDAYEISQWFAGPDMSPLPVFLSSDATVICKEMGAHPIIGESPRARMCRYQMLCTLRSGLTVPLGFIYDDVRSEPGSWVVVGKILVFDETKATRTKLRTEDGLQGASRRRIFIADQCFGALLEGCNALTKTPKILQWADGVWRKTHIMLSGLLSDQPEADTYCCEGAQT